MGSLQEGLREAHDILQQLNTLTNEDPLSAPAMPAAPAAAAGGAADGAAAAAGGEEEEEEESLSEVRCSAGCQLGCVCKAAERHQ